MSEEEKDRKVINLFTRSPHIEPEPLGSSEPDEHEIDEGAVALLETILEEAKLGHVRGVLILSGVPGQAGAVDFVQHGCSDSVFDHDQIFIGACSTVSASIIAIVEADLYIDE